MTKHAQTLLIEGPDARAFAQAQFSSSVNSLETGHWQFSAWLSAQGRVRSFFHLVRLADDKYLMLLRGGAGACVAEALRRFVFRAKLVIREMPERNLATGPALPLHATEYMGDVLTLGCGTHSMQLGAISADNAAWPQLQLHTGWAWLPESTLGELLPGALSMQRLAAVVVDKGCYPGQEIVARLHFRGGHKRHLHRGTLSHAAVPGQLLTSQGKEIGVVLDVLSNDAATEAQFVLSDDVTARVQAGEEGLFDESLQIHIAESWPV